MNRTFEWGYHGVVAVALLVIVVNDIHQGALARSDFEAAARSDIATCIVTRDDEPVHDMAGRAKIDAACRQKEAEFRAEFGHPSTAFTEMR